MASTSEIANAFFLVYAALFPVVNPIGSVPIFLGLTKRCSNQQRTEFALKIAYNSFFMLIGSLFIGSHVLEFFGITLPILRIAGGLVVSVMGWKLLQTPDDAADEHGLSLTDQPPRPPEAFYPLTMPLTIGPGSISVAVTLGSQRPPGGMVHLALAGSGAVAGLVAVCLTIYLCYRFAEGMMSRLGSTGARVVTRLSAFILFCIGIQITWGGFSTLPGGLPGH